MIFILVLILGEVITPTATNLLSPQEDHRPSVTPAKFNPETCTDSSVFSCADYIRSRGSFVCYSNVTAATCCQSCRKIKNVQDEGNYN